MRQLYLLTVLLSIQYSSFSQEATTSTSGSGQTGSIVFDWSLGELTLVNTFKNGNLMLTQGLHQGSLVAFPVTSTIGDGELLVTPNPTPGQLVLQTGFLEPGKLTIQLYDAQGKLLAERSEVVSSFGTRTMDLSAYASGVYMLHAAFSPSAGKARKRTYKIIKY